MCFVIGCSCLLVWIYIYLDKLGYEIIDVLFEFFICLSIFFLLYYVSVKVCEEKFCYVVYNCVVIDIDMSLWEE